MKKIIHVISDTNVGGAGKQLINCLKNFDKNKYDIKVVIPKNSLLKPQIERLNYEAIEINGNKDKSFDVKTIFSLLKIFKREKPDIVHTHSSMSGKIAALFAGVKVRLYTRHCAFPPGKLLTSFPGKQINGFVDNILATHIIASADAAKNDLILTGIKPDKITVILNGVEGLPALTNSEKEKIRTDNNIKPDDFLVGIIARLEESKGLKYFIDCIDILTKKYGSLKGIIIGTGSYEKALKAQIAELNISDKIIFTGFVEDVTPYVNIIDINVNCSYLSETSSLALSEGMSLSKPIVATLCGGNDGMVTDGENGFLVPIRNSIEMAAAIGRLIDDRALYEKMSENARLRYENKFTAQNMTKQLEKIYEGGVF